MRRVRPFLLLGIAVLSLLPAAVLQARVFRRAGWLWRGGRFVPEELGKGIYRAPMLINGAQAEVNVVACDSGAGGLRRMLTSDGSVTARFTGNGDLAIGEMKGYGKTVSFVSLAPASDGVPGVVIAVERGSADPAVVSPLPRHELHDVPLVSGGRVTCALRNTLTRTTWETVVLTGPPAAALSFYQTAMRRAGWTPMSPTPAGDGGGMLCFVKGTDVCFVWAGCADSDGETQLALLHKQGAAH